MKLVHIESGLGNQMLNYAEYLAIKKSNPKDDCYIENIIYNIPDVNRVISQWNGYELDTIFSLNIPNIMDIIPYDIQQKVIKYVKNSEFWLNGWAYPEAILGGLNIAGLAFENLCRPRVENGSKRCKARMKGLVNETEFGASCKLFVQNMFPSYFLNRKSHSTELFIESNQNLYLGQTGYFMHLGNGIEKIRDELLSAFRFPMYDSKHDIDLAEYLKQSNSVSIHARRGDALAQAGRYYKTGYFKRAVNYIKKNIKNPVFVFFSDPGSMNWCKENLCLFSLSFHDEIIFIDWHVGQNNYRDMQLMAECKNNIIMYSSFSWWASFLNNNEDKITISPMYTMNTTHHF